MRNYIMYCRYGAADIDVDIVEAENLKDAEEQARTHLMERVEYHAVPLNSKTAKEYGLEREYKQLKEKGHGH